MKTIEQHAIETEFYRLYKGESFRAHLELYLDSALCSGALDIDHQPTAETARQIFHAALAAYARPGGPAAGKITDAIRKEFLFV